MLKICILLILYFFFISCLSMLCSIVANFGHHPLLGLDTWLGFKRMQIYCLGGDKSTILDPKFITPNLKVVFFEKVTKFDEIFTLFLTNEFVFLCFLPNFEFSVIYSRSLSSALWDPPEKSWNRAKLALVRNEQKRQTNLSASGI